MPTTSIWDIFYADTSTALSIADITAAVADSVEAALGAQANYRYVETVYFTSSGSFAKADYDGLRAVRFKVQAGGGGGGGGVTSPSNQAGSGGGGGGYAEAFVTDIAGMASSVTITVGAGGTAGAAGGTGGTGGTSSAGSYCSATGGLGGKSPTDGNGGLGGTGTGDFARTGGSGGSSPRSAAEVPSGYGGASHLGGSVAGAVGFVAGTGNTGLSYGGGGSGATRNSTGGAGAPGIVIVDIYV